MTFNGLITKLNGKWKIQKYLILINKSQMSNQYYIMISIVLVQMRIYGLHFPSSKSISSEFISNVPQT